MDKRQQIENEMSKIEQFLQLAEKFKQDTDNPDHINMFNQHIQWADETYKKLISNLRVRFE